MIDDAPVKIEFIGKAIHDDELYIEAVLVQGCPKWDVLAMLYIEGGRYTLRGRIRLHHDSKVFNSVDPRIPFEYQMRELPSVVAPAMAVKSAVSAVWAISLRYAQQALQRGTIDRAIAFDFALRGREADVLLVQSKKLSDLADALDTLPAFHKASGAEAEAIINRMKMEEN